MSVQYDSRFARAVAGKASPRKVLSRHLTMDALCCAPVRIIGGGIRSCARPATVRAESGLHYCPHHRPRLKNYAHET